MAISFGSSSTNSGQNASSLTLSVPSGTANGDLLILAISIDISGVTVTMTGWTQLDTFNDTTDSERFYTFYRVASSEPSSYTITPSVNPVDIVAAMVRYTGVDNTTPIHLHPTKTTKTGGTSLASPALTGVSGTDLSVLIWCHGAVNQGTYTQTPPGSPWNSRVATVTAFASNFNVGIAILDQLATSATATTSVSVSCGLMCTAVALTAAAATASPLPVSTIVCQAVTRAAYY